MEGRETQLEEKESKRADSKTKVKSKTLLGNALFKIVIFLLLLASGVATVAGVIGTAAVLELDGFSQSAELIIYERMENMAYRDALYLVDLVTYNTKYAIQDRVDAYLDGSNASFCMYEQDTGNIYWTWGTKDLYDYKYTIEDISIPGLFDKTYSFTLYIDKDLKENDKYRKVYDTLSLLLYNRYELLKAACGGAILTLLLFWLFLWSAGHKNGREGIVPTVLTPIWFDVLTAVFALGGMAYFFASERLLMEISGSPSIREMIAIVGTLFVIGGMIPLAYLREFVIRIKLGKWWRNTFLYQTISLVFRCVGKILGFWVNVIKKIPLVPRASFAILAICALEFLGIAACAGIGVVHGGERSVLVVLWFLEKLLVVPFLLYLAIQFKKLQVASRELAKGQLSSKVDTTGMFWDVKEHGENLNHIGEGMSKVVEEKMKSERLKTELITNVSHDIKTPLTSIINYADLLGGEGLTREEIGEYSEVLLRQSRRLKKLLEDLLEASKATTGNLEVNIEKCQIGVLLSQAAGEYGQRFQEKGLQMILRTPEKEIAIPADGKHLWRVFDNLLNNVYKYAQENTRVFLSLEEQEDRAVVTFRNTSKYELEASAEELMERFARGDRSRNMEGNGLGLSIAKSLVELQDGDMDVFVDGDLFKVILKFREINVA